MLIFQVSLYVGFKASPVKGVYFVLKWTCKFAHKLHKQPLKTVTALSSPKKEQTPYV